MAMLRRMAIAFFHAAAQQSMRRNARVQQFLS
jgi:hypothetical protein